MKLTLLDGLTLQAFFNAFFGLLFCGLIPPGKYKAVYSNKALAVFCAFFSPLRFFVEVSPEWK